MWENILKLDGTIEKKDGTKFKSSEFFDFLESNGYKYIGGYENYIREDMMKTIDYISSQVSDEVVKRMMVQCKVIYGQESTLETLKETLLDEYGGTSSFTSLFLYSMTEEINNNINKYSNASWTISDEFNVLLGEKVVEKITELGF